MKKKSAVPFGSRYLAGLAVAALLGAALPARADDGQVQKKVEARLEKAKLAQDGEIAVAVSGGNVTLTGAVTTVAAQREALKQARPVGLRYATLRLADGVSFIHLVSHEEADGVNALTALPAFKAFAAGIKERCEEQPVRVELTEIGSYGFFGE